jgi:hypothetical protein
MVKYNDNDKSFITAIQCLLRVVVAVGAAQHWPNQ